jgi:hypothetical protein
MNRRTTSLLAWLVVVSAAVCVYAVTSLYDASTEARLAFDTVRQSRAQVATIIAMQQRKAGVVTDAGGAPTPEITRRIHDAAAGAGIPEGMPGQGIVRIDPAAPQRLPGTDMTEIDVPVRLQRVEVGQVVRLLYMLCDAEPSLGVKSVSLASPGSEDQSPTWDVDVTITWRTRG